MKIVVFIVTSLNTFSYNTSFKIPSSSLRLENSSGYKVHSYSSTHFRTYPSIRSTSLASVVVADSTTYENEFPRSHSNHSAFEVDEFSEVSVISSDYDESSNGDNLEQYFNSSANSINSNSHYRDNLTVSVVDKSPSDKNPPQLSVLQKELDKKFFDVSIPAFVGLAAEPLVGIIDGSSFNEICLITQEVRDDLMDIIVTYFVCRHVCWKT
jgi:hypothetical protein